MNNEANSSWPSMVPSSGDEFASFIDLPDLDIDSSNLDNGASAGEHVEDGQSELRNHYGQHTFFGGDVGAHEEGMIPRSASATDINMLKRISGLQVQPGSYPQAEHHTQFGSQAMQFHHQGVIPPTPTSLDIHGNRSHFNTIDAQQQTMYDAQLRKQQQEMVFTPLGTPAVTPLDIQYQMPEYAIPGEYFSPLASPALIAQSVALVERSVYGHLQSSDHSEATSPVDINFDQSLQIATTSAPASKRQKKRPSPTIAKQGTRSVRQSPAMKPQRKKQSTSTVIPAKEVTEIMKSAARPSSSGGPQRKGGSLEPPTSQLSSESGSISPEPLSDLMPPPATPKAGSAGKSPYMSSQMHKQSAHPNSMNAPATPRSLMEIQQPTSNLQSQANSSEDAEMQDISLGAAALDTGPFSPTFDTRTSDSQSTPTITARKGDLNTSTTSSASVLPSPTTSSAPTPRSLANKAKNDFKAPAKGKKRNSSSHPSPALRPRISPSIKPLLPEGATMNAETSALLLASKSNYQNIIEGTHLPGVNYPEALSENLTSKRTSHKIAEQGRRNRINTALQEIASLLPHGKTGSEGELSISPSGPQSSSKASTVEAAIDYIKSLQEELNMTKEKLSNAEGKLKEVQSPSPGKDR